MKILVVNCGSSSLKYQLIDMKTEAVLAKGIVERIGLEGSTLTQKSIEKGEFVLKTKISDHKEAINYVLHALSNEEHGVIKSMDEIGAVGHRIVHGGEKYSSSVIIDDDVMKTLEEYVKLAPLHNPPNIIGINACKEIMKDIPMVGVFDTSFHQTMPEKAYIYPIPYELYKDLKIRKYGFHGTSHKFVSAEAAKFLGKDIKDLKIITCHLGNGASVAAIKGGCSIDTTMGFTPLEGVAMGTRCGNIDPAVVTFLMKEKNLSPDDVDRILNKESGVYGISGVSSDYRDVEKAECEGNKRAKIAMEIFYYRVKLAIGAYAAALGGVDCIVFTAGYGENSARCRREVCDGLQFMGVEVDDEKNKIRGMIGEVSSTNSKVKVLVVPTNEELMIARDTELLVRDAIN